MFITHVLLATRGANSDLMIRGRYVPLTFSGRMAKHAFGFRRFTDAQELLIVVPRLTRALGDLPVGAAWGDTRVMGVEHGPDWRCLIHGNFQAGAGGTLGLRQIFAALPVVVLLRNRLR